MQTSFLTCPYIQLFQPRKNEIALPYITRVLVKYPFLNTIELYSTSQPHGIVSCYGGYMFIYLCIVTLSHLYTYLCIITLSIIKTYLCIVHVTLSNTYTNLCIINLSVILTSALSFYRFVHVPMHSHSVNFVYLPLHCHTVRFAS